ncbi:hypothetical protein DFH07DRAFT_768086 [Mycena maculata]|uniref:Uncharacterized protein n=1 Tax=Mycena maculata TaxID=230809 RepID=A0AAD7JYF0_9AGAR|nr:hypothetical protein DFH07DRAFT_768086 [Mycena maculata]
MVTLRESLTQRCHATSLGYLKGLWVSSPKNTFSSGRSTFASSSKLWGRFTSVIKGHTCHEHRPPKGIESEGADRISRSCRHTIVVPKPGKAYNFFTQEVAMSAARVDLHRFFEALFNHCFLLDNRLEQKASCLLRNAYTTSVMSTSRPWLINCGLACAHIFRRAWMKDLSPETSTWADVRFQAEVIESLELTREPSNSNMNHGGNNGHSNKGKSGGFKRGVLSGINSNTAARLSNANASGSSTTNGRMNSYQNDNGQ